MSSNSKESEDAQVKRVYEFYILRLCKSSAAYEAIPKKNLKLNINECAEMLEKTDFNVINAGVMLIVTKSGECECTLYPSGRMLLRTDAEEEARRTMEHIYTTLIYLGV